MTKQTALPCVFIGQDGSLGYRRGRIYRLTVVGKAEPRIIKPTPCPYASWDKFYENWVKV